MSREKTTQNPRLADIVRRVRNEEFISAEDLDLLRQYYTIPDNNILYPKRIRRNPQIKIIGETLRRLKK